MWPFSPPCLGSAAARSPPCSPSGVGALMLISCCAVTSTRPEPTSSPTRCARLACRSDPYLQVRAEPPRSCVRLTDYALISPNLRRQRAPVSRIVRRKRLQISRRAAHHCAPLQLPRWTAASASVGCFPATCSLPRNSGGSASTTSLSRPAQASLALRPVGLLSRPRRPLSRGFDRLVAQTGRSSATRSTDNSLGGTFLHWWRAPSGRTEISGLVQRGIRTVRRNSAAGAPFQRNPLHRLSAPVH